MMTLTLPETLETEIKSLAGAEHQSTEEMAFKLIAEAIQSHKKQLSNDNSALEIHEQLMAQYADTFNKLAQ